MPTPNLLCLSLELSLAGVDREDYVFIGTTVMWLHQLLLRVGDIDMFVAPTAYRKLKAHGWSEETPTPGDPPMLAWDCDGQRVNAWWEWDDRHIGGEIVNEAFATREWVCGYPCVPLTVLKRWKVEAGRPKDRTHVALIDNHLAKLARQ